MEQHQTSIKVSSTLNRRGLSAHLFNLLYTRHPFPGALFVLTIQPLFIGFGEIYRALEDPGPFQMCGVEMRMANDYSFQASLPVDEVDSCLIDEGNNVPEYITLRCLDQDGTLAYAELFLSRSCACKTLR